MQGCVLSQTFILGYGPFMSAALKAGCSFATIGPNYFCYLKKPTLCGTFSCQQEIQIWPGKGKVSSQESSSQVFCSRWREGAVEAL